MLSWMKNAQKLWISMDFTHLLFFFGGGDSYTTLGKKEQQYTGEDMFKMFVAIDGC